MELRLASKAIEEKTTTIIGKEQKDSERVSRVGEYLNNPFIKANTKSVSLSHLQKDCIVPVFSKDNEKTIAHFEFIDVVVNTVSKVFSHHSIESPEIRTSHIIKGRVPTAIHKPVKELLEHEKTIYYERMAFVVRIPSITETINGNKLSLIVGGVRAYNKENLYSKKSVEKFQVFIGFQNMVCCNLCISTDGMKSEMRVGSANELAIKVQDLITSYNSEKHLKEMLTLTDYSLTERQFAQLVGKSRLYNYLPKNEKLNIPQLLLNDGQISTVAKDYYQDESFCRNDNGDINLWKVYNLFTQANKSSYIDTFSDRNVNAFEFTNGLKNSLNGDSNYHWFLS